MTVPTPIFQPRVAQAVFMVLPFTPDHEKVGGTGFLVATVNHGTILLTNRHVCEALDANNRVYYADQGQESYIVRRLTASNVTDLCAIIVPPELLLGHQPLALGAKELQPGEHANVYGHPYLNPLTYSDGSFKNISREPLRFKDGAFDPEAVFSIGRLAFMVQPGNSGSPVLNDRGEVVGIVFAMEGASHMGLFLPLETVRAFLNTLE